MSPTIPKCLPTPRDIERWVPANLNEVVGCADLKAHFFDQIRLDARGVNTLVRGEPGTGKTASVKAFVRSLMCPNLDDTTFLPCGSCSTCLNFDVRFSDEGLFAIAQPRVSHGKDPLNFFPINCGVVTETELKKILSGRAEYTGRFLIYLDEVHRIVRRQMDHLLLKPLEEMDALWIASSAQPDELGGMFLRRFSAHLSTTLPALQELTEFLDARCKDWQIAVDDAATLTLLARRSGRITASAISVLALAAGTLRRCLDRDLVIRHFSA